MAAKRKDVHKCGLDNGIGRIADGIAYRDAFGCGIVEVNIVHSGCSLTYHLKVLSGIYELPVHDYLIDNHHVTI